MDPNDKDLKEQLAHDPFARSGFDGRLRQRIEERIGTDKGRSRHPRQITWRWPATAFASVAAVLLGVWLWHGQTGDGQTSKGIQQPNALGAESAPSVSRAEQPRRYALLIGLRNDQAGSDGNPASSYRTLLVAPEKSPDRLRLMAENTGLYLPYKQNFWQLSTISSTDGRKALQAIQITNRKNKRIDDPVSIPDYMMSQKVLYAGNEYLSVSSTIRVGKEGREENRMVKHIDQINSKPADPGAEPHIVLQDVVPDVNRGLGRMDQWSIVRNPGQWVPELYNPFTGEEDPLPNLLPRNVVQNDTLSMSWEQIQKIEPAAKDAFTYGNVFGAITKGAIRVFAVRGGTALPDSVTIPLAAGESVVMIQWAEGDTYVDRWIKDMQALSRVKT